MFSQQFSVGSFQDLFLNFNFFLMIVCSTCKNEIETVQCKQCTQTAALKRIDSHYISHELFHLWHIEKGFLFNVREFILRPANSIREFLNVDRSRHMKPVAFLIFIALINSIIANYYRPVVAVTENDSYFKGSFVEILSHWTETHAGYTYIMHSFFIAFWTKILFKKYGYNFYEIMTLLCFIIGQTLFITALLLPFHQYLNQTANNIILLTTLSIYPIIVIATFFDKNKILSYIKAFFSFFLGKITFIFLMYGIGLSIDLILKIFK